MLLTPKVEFTPQGVLDSLASGDCPACDRQKKAGNPLCLTCFRKLHWGTRFRLAEAAKAMKEPARVDAGEWLVAAMVEALRRLTDGDTSEEGESLGVQG